jgi:hypothetical protein
MTLTSRAKQNAGAVAILQQLQLLALELDGMRAVLADLGRERVLSHLLALRNTLELSLRSRVGLRKVIESKIMIQFDLK